MVVNCKLITTRHGAIKDKTQRRSVAFYNLDMILAIGYRVRSVRGIQLRNYASTILKEYVVKGFAIDDKRMKTLAGQLLIFQHNIVLACYRGGANKASLWQYVSFRRLLGTTLANDVAVLQLVTASSLVVIFCLLCSH
ncbi:RhuM family protein [Arcanobacterium phocae]|uniref:RhuM family protein n=1 Tax=Arcanobacterium phocae TaxID=131112 RepID=UPI001C0F7A00